MLLVLDNFELVLSGASLVLELLESCPGIKFLATSQELLANAEDRLRHTERHVRLQPLGLPTLQQLGDLTALRAAPAMRLLIARASKERENFDVTPETAEDLIKICHLTDGLPLAIELVASVVAANDVAAVLSELERDGWDELDRSKKVATALTWRYTALTAEDQQLFRRIAVFAGGFTHDAAKQVFSRMGYPPPTVARLSSLSRQNLLRLDSSAKRYQLLWLVQEYGLQELERSGEAAALRQHHADYFRQFLEQQEPTADSGSRLDWLRRVQQEYGNLKAVMLRSLSDQLDIQTGLAIAGRLFWYWNLKGHFGEGRRMLRNFLDRGAGSDDQRARLLYGEGGLAFLQGDYVFAKKQLAASEELWRRSPERDRRGLAYSLVILGMVRRELNEELEDARANEEESVSIFRAVKDNWGLALALNDLGNVLVADRQYGRGRAQYEESKALWQKLNEQWGLALTLGNLGHLSCLEKEYGTARDFFEDALTIQRKQSDTWGIAWSLKGVGDVAVGQQKFEEAAKNYFESFRMHWAIARRQLISECVEGLGVVARWQAQWERAAQLLAAADNLSCGRKPEHEREAYVNSEKAVRAALGDRFQEAWREGHRWDAEQLLQHVHAYAADLMAPGSPQAAAAIELAPVAAPLPSVRADNVANVERKIGAGEFDVFLCHNSQDKEAVKEIGKQLIKAGLRPWLDEWELRPGLPWMRALEEQISKIRSAAVFVGESGLGPWQDAEREAFIDEFRRRGCPVIPVILSGTEKTPALPLFLKQMTWVDFRKREPDPLRSLIWGITGERT
jgi:predicted ATPase/nucleotide-binding universal stress UspA family protein